MSKKIIVEGYDISQLPHIPKDSKWVTISEFGIQLKNEIKKIYEDNTKKTAEDMRSLKSYRKEVHFRKLNTIELENEQFVKDLCSKYGLEYWKGDGVYGEKEQFETMKIVYEIISQRMEVGEKIHWLDGADNCYAFSFYSKHPVTL